MIFCCECYQKLAPDSPYKIYINWECEDCGRNCMGYEPLDLTLVKHELRNPNPPPRTIY